MAKRDGVRGTLDCIKIQRRQVFLFFPFELEMRETHCEDGTTSLPSVAGSSNAGGPPAPAFRDSFAHAFIARADLDRSRSLRRWSRVAFAARFSCGGWTKGGRM